MCILKDVTYIFLDNPRNLNIATVHDLDVV